MTRRVRLCVIAVALMMLSGCGAGEYAQEFTGDWKGAGRSSLHLKSSGHATGSDGCNDFTASWKSTSPTKGELHMQDTTDASCPAAGWNAGDNYVLVRNGDRLTVEYRGLRVASLSRVGK